MAKKCKCKVTTDGECEVCKGLASTAGNRFQGLVSEFARSYEALEKEFMEKLEGIKVQLAASGQSFGAVGRCERCTDKYADFAISKMIGGLRSNERDIAFGTSFIKAFQTKLAKRGIKHFPLTEKAWGEISK